MVLSEFLDELLKRGIKITEWKFRFAVKTGRLPKPRMNAAHQFDFTTLDVEKAAELFGSKQEAAQCV